MLASSGARPTMHRVKDRWTELFILSLSLCCSMGQVIQFQSVSILTITEGGGVTRSVCLASSALASNDISFSLSASPFTSELTLPANPFIPQGRSCETVTITSVDNIVRQDTRTFQISLSSSTADVDQNQSQFLINIEDNDFFPGGTVCPTPTVINSSPDSCNSFTSGSICTYRCNNGFVRLSGDGSRTCSNIFRWSGNPLFCIPIIIQFQSVSSATITEGGGVTRGVCLASSALASNDMSFSLSASPGTSELALPTNLFILQGRSCETVTITSMDNNVRQDTRTFQISLSSSTADVDQNQGQFLINILDNDFTPGGTVSMCPSPTVINSSPVSCNSFTSGSTCMYSCKNGFVRLSGDGFRTCSRFTFRWSGNPLFCIPSINGCTSNPCMNGGSCIDHFHGYSCQCTAGYTGINCEEDIGECNLDEDNCSPDASCMNNFGSFTCRCNNGYSGDGITCVDDVPPTVSNCPGNGIVIYIGTGETQGEAMWTEPTASDVSGATLVSRSHLPGGDFQLGATDVEYKFEDGLNNTATCQFTVFVYAATITCPPSITISYGDQLSFATSVCTLFIGSTSQSSPSTCMPQNGMRAEEDALGVCSCSIAPHISCTFQVTVTTRVQCPSPKTISHREVLTYNVPQCINKQDSRPASCFPSTGSSVNTNTLVTCSCPQDDGIQCRFQIFVDCIVLQTTFCGNAGVSCNCMDESCDPDTGLCSSNCTIVNTCPASIESKSLSQVNPFSSVNFNCTLRGSTTILQRLQLRLSNNADSFDNNGITRLTRNGVNTGDKLVLTFRVENVTKERTFFCIILQGNYLIGGVSVKKFVYELPVLNSAPISEDISNNLITIIWRPWDPTMDNGDPPIVAYIPYYRMDASDVWVSGPRILSNETLQFTADNLEVDTLYEFSVAAVREGENGEGRRGPVVALKTYCNVPDVTASVNVQLTSSNQVNVSWQLPPGEVMCSTGVTSYKVYYRIEGSTDDTPQLAGTVEDADTTSLIIDDELLEPESSYIFFVTVTTDQESGFRESEAFEVPAAGTSALVFLISLIVISVILIGIIVVFIKIRYRRKSSSKDKKTVKVDDDGVDTDYVNAAIADDPEVYIPLEEQSRTVSSSKYEDLNLKPQGGASVPTQYEVTIVPQPQKPEATPRYQTRNVKGVNSGAYEDVGVSSENRQLPDVPQSHPSDNEDEEHGYVVPDRLEEYTGVYINIKNNRKLVQPGPIKVAEFHMFMSRNKEDVVNDIVQQFMALPSGPQYPWSDALKFQNKPRNFFKTILAYDHSRVKLDTYGSDDRSDYINASYIKNQQGKTSFIAAQGPQEGTVDDFWKMVWQENVETIVMVTDNIEKNKLLCCNYWPKKVHMSEMFDDITVLLMESTSYTTHTIRKLNLLKGDHKTVHTVTQVHVHSWQYGSVPKDPVSLISIIKKVKTLQTDGSSSPLLVHCSNGVGATGTFITVYVLMDTIKKNKDVNIFDFVKRMRDDRVDMVHTRIQYLFIFECLLAVLQSTDSQISCDQLKKLGHAAVKLKSKKEYKVLEESAIEKHQCKDYIGNSPENQYKNRFKNLIPVDKSRPVLKFEGSTFGSNSYINAVHLTDFSGREFIMTQTPLSSTVEDFWRLVYDYECTTIVMLNTVGGSDETVVQYWPSGGGGGAQYGLMTVECMSITKSDSYIHSQFQVAHKKVGEKSLSVDHFVFSGWSGNQPDVSRLRQFIRITGNKSTGVVLVHCINGVGLSSVYVIAKTESERLEQEGSVDIFQCLTKLRKICPHAIQTQEEYTLCYLLLKDHLDNPEEYAVVY